MIDTVHLRIDSRKYRNIFFQCLEYWKQKRYAVKTKAEPYLNIGVIDYSGSRLSSAKGEVSLPSSHYKIQFIYYEDRGCIDVNLSVPKYMYGNNVLQYIVSQGDYEMGLGWKTVEFQKKHSWLLFNRFIDDFIKNIFFNKIPREDLEVRRIDFCFNQVFNSGLELEYYYENLKKVRVKNLREGSNKLSSYESSFHYVGSGYSFKVYKKGVEFAKNDRREMEKANEKLVRKFNIEGLQDLAYRTLRYEMTIRNEYMTRIYREKVYRKDCPVWSNLAKGIRIKDEGIEVKARHEDLKVYRVAKYKVVNFYLGVSPEVSLSNTRYDGQVKECAKFSKYFYEILLERFWLKVADFKLENISVLDKSLFRLMKGKKLNVIKKIHKIVESRTLEQAYEEGDISVATFYRYKKLLKAYGVGATFMHVGVNAKFDYENYFMTVINRGLLIKR